MKKTIPIILLACSALCFVFADAEADFREVARLFSSGKANDARKLLLSIAVPTNRIDLAFQQVELNLASDAFIGNARQRIASQPDQDAPLTWGLKLSYAHGLLSSGKTNEAHQIYQSFTNRFAQTPGITNTYFWILADRMSRVIEERKVKVQQDASSLRR